MKLTIRKMANIAIFAALVAVFSQISIPIGPVPINLALLAVFAAGGMLSAAEAVFAVLLFLALGGAGLPVFAGFNAGLGALAGPTGGYLIGYLPAAFLAGVFCKEHRSFARYALGMLLGLAACYILGTAWFVISAKAEIWHLRFSVFTGGCRKDCVGCVFEPESAKSAGKPSAGVGRRRTLVIEAIMSLNGK